MDFVLKLSAASYHHVCEPSAQGLVRLLEGHLDLFGPAAPPPPPDRVGHGGVEMRVRALPDGHLLDVRAATPGSDLAHPGGPLPHDGDPLHHRHVHAVHEGDLHAIHRR